MQKRKSRKGFNRADINLGVALRRASNAHGISQDDLAFKAGYSRSYIGYLERGEKSPTVRTLLELCLALKVSPSSIPTKVEQTQKSKP
jgi:transcriptional regulator with XRE-family HTH domain